MAVYVRGYSRGGGSVVRAYTRAKAHHKDAQKIARNFGYQLSGPNASKVKMAMNEMAHHQRNTNYYGKQLKSKIIRGTTAQGTRRAGTSRGMASRRRLYKRFGLK